MLGFPAAAPTRPCVRENGSIRFAVEPSELDAARRIRHQVFVIEQGVFVDHDRDDLDEDSITIIAVDDQEPIGHNRLNLRSNGQQRASDRLCDRGTSVVGTVRIHRHGQPRIWYGSRLALLPSHRGAVTTAAGLIRRAVASACVAGCDRFLAHIQPQNRRLFERLGWDVLDEVVHEGQPHLLVEADLELHTRRAKMSELETDWARYLATDVSAARQPTAKDQPATVCSQKNARRNDFSSKAEIAVAITRLGLSKNSTIPVGDDTAAIPRGDGAGYDLLACEGMDGDFVQAMPWFAGWSSVMVNLSDIASMGGTATALVNAVWSRPGPISGELFEGMRTACEAYGVPMVGGHTNLHSDTTQLAVSVFGHATSLLTSFDAKPGHQLIMAVDLNGDWKGDYPFWDAATRQAPSRLRHGLSLLPQVAEQGLAIAAKDISQAGVLGTTVMLCETSRVGVQVDLESIPRPPGVDFERWLKAFPSFGFVFACSSETAESLVELFEANDITACRIGEFNDSRIVKAIQEDTEVVVRDLSAKPLMGC